MSLLLNENKNVFAQIVNAKTNKVEGTISYEDNNLGIRSVELNEGFKYQLVPRPLKEKERMTLFIAGQSGAGKSWYTMEYAKKYHNMFPNNHIYLISNLAHDETLDSYKVIQRLTGAMKPEFLNECLDLDLKSEFGNSFVIFDDVDNIVNKKVKDKIYGLLNKMLMIGRHYNISVAYVGHTIYGNHELKCILNESMTITFFPRYLNYKKLKYLLEEYFGLSKEQIAKIRSIKDRSITYIKGADKIILSDTKCFILEDDF